jgi:4'-phosphopantetheinyl transferase
MTTRLWWVRPETFQASRAEEALLDVEERQQHQRFIPPAKQHEYLVTRVLVRTVLGAALGIAPETLRFTRNRWGRPSLSPQSHLRFSVSHTDGLVVCLVSAAHEVGVDTELFARAPKLLALAPNVFAPVELGELAALPITAQPKRAVILWTLKESYVKACGMGLSIPLDSFAFRFEAENGRIELALQPSDETAHWQFQTHELGKHCVSTTIASTRMEPVEIEVLEAFPAGC